MKASSTDKLQALAARVVTNAQDIALDATTAAYVTAARVEKKLLELPRPLKGMHGTWLKLALLNATASASMAAYAVSTGKSFAIGVADRRLTKPGKLMMGADFTLFCLLAALSAYELWARQREQVAVLKKTVAKDSMQNMSYADMLAALKGPVNLDQLDGLVARMSAAPVGSMSDLRFDQIATGKG